MAHTNILKEFADYPTSDKEWVRYFTITNYLTENEMEYRRKRVEENSCNFEKIIEEVRRYRAKHKEAIFEYKNKKFVLCETKKLKDSIEEMKEFYKSIEYHFKDKFNNKLIVDSLILEAFSSSSIEGAHSTVKRTNELVVKKEEPKDKSEKMILNNYDALEFLRKKNDDLSSEFVCEVHKIVSAGTLDKNEDEGAYRSEAVEIMSDKGKVIFSPTANIDEMREMTNKLYEFLLDDDFRKPIENIYKAIAFHFIFSYIHPFMDGNGRTVRVLFTYLLKKYGFDMFYFISLSEVIYKQKNIKKYYEAFVHVERSEANDELDMTYFFYYMVNVMQEGIEILKDRVKNYMREDFTLDKAKTNSLDLTPRQKLIIKMLSNSKRSFMQTSDEIAQRIKVSKQTAIKDLKYLIQFELVKAKKIGRNKFYSLSIEL